MSDRHLSRRLAGAPGRLVRQLAALVAGPSDAVPMFPMLVVEDVSTRPWASATFEGERHAIALRLCGDSETIGAALDRLVEQLPEAEFDLPGQIVAEAKLVSLAVYPDPMVAALALRIDFLTVVD